jgi:bacterioferritin
MTGIDQEEVVAVLNRILESELAGVVRYTHYSFLVFGFGRIPIQSWLRAQADESLLHAQQAGEWITTLGAYPSLAIGPLLDSHTFDIASILRESL